MSARSLVRLTAQSNRELAARAVDGDRDAFVELVRRYDARLRGLAARLLGGDRHRMDDALQDAYLRAYQALPGFRQDADFGTWLYRITYNACIEQLRRSGGRPPPIDTTDVAHEPVSRRAAPDDAAAASDLAERALALLTPDQQAAVILVDGQGFDHRAAAEILGVAVGTMWSRLSRARAEVRRGLAGAV